MIEKFIKALESLMITGDMEIADENMIIPPETFEVMWYEDKDGKRIPNSVTGDLVNPPNAAYYVTRFPLELQEVHNRIIRQEDVDTCVHPSEYVVPTYGWVDGLEGRECKSCHGTQVKKVDEPWPTKWEARGSRVMFSFNNHLGKSSEELVLAMANSGDYSLSQSILIVAQSCERCCNVLLYKYLNGKDGYAEYSDEWMKCNTECKFCAHETVGKPAELFGVTKDVPNNDNLGVIPPFDPKKQIKRMTEVDSSKE
jgi:hypothetical protein